MDITTLTSIPDLARAHGVSRQTAWVWVRETPGLRPSRAGRMYLLSREDVRRVLERPRKRMGRPCATRAQG